MVWFADRAEAGRRLAARLSGLRPDGPGGGETGGAGSGGGVVVLGLPRGGVPVAAPVAEELGAPLDVCLVRKLGVPFHPELGMGAIGEGGVRVVNDEVVRTAGVTPGELAGVEAEERTVLQRRAARYRGGREPVPLAGRTAVVVDDGLATGSTARAACRIVRAAHAARVVLAVPVAPPDWTRWMAGEADELVCVDTPGDFLAIGHFDADFAQTEDAEVVAALDRAAARTARREEPPGGAGTAAVDQEVLIPSGAVRLGGRLTVPAGAPGIVLFAHGSGSGRHSPRNRSVAAGLRAAGLGTLLFDLLTPQEADDRDAVFDIGLLAGRLADATGWLRERPGIGRSAIGYFGASTGSAAALRAATRTGARIAAVVSRGGRPDLTGPRLAEVTAPTLLIVGGADPGVLALNQEAQSALRGENRLAVVPGAGHLFAEPGALERVTELAREWFTAHLAPPP